MVDGDTAAEADPVLKVTVVVVMLLMPTTLAVDLGWLLLLLLLGMKAVLVAAVLELVVLQP